MRDYETLKLSTFRLHSKDRGQCLTGQSKKQRNRYAVTLRPLFTIKQTLKGSPNTKVTPREVRASKTRKIVFDAGLASPSQSSDNKSGGEDEQASHGSWIRHSAHLQCFKRLFLLKVTSNLVDVKNPFQYLPTCLF